MISNLRMSVAELVVWALLAAAGLTWISFRVVDGAAWLMDWLRDRVTPLLEADEDRIDPDDPYDACPECGSWTQCEHDRERLGLPPERTWEQMTSHQLPVEQPWRVLPCPDEETHPHQPGILYTHDLATHYPDGRRRGFTYGTGNGRDDEARERRAPWWEVQQRAAYESLGFDYPSGLMARVRELTP